MYLDFVTPAISGAGYAVQATAYKTLITRKPAAQSDLFERLPMNLSNDEIRAMVREVLG